MLKSTEALIVLDVCLLTPSILFLVRCSQLEVYNELLKILKIKLYYFSSFKK